MRSKCYPTLTVGSDSITPGRLDPALPAFHHSKHEGQIVGEDCVRGTRAKVMLDAIVGLVLVRSRLLSSVHQGKEPQMVIGPYLVDPMLPLYLAVVAKRSNPDLLIFDAHFIQCLFKQGFIIGIIANQGFGELRPIVRLDTLNVEWCRPDEQQQKLLGA